MDYIAQLRKYVGHAPLQMLAAAALIVDDKGRLLLLKRCDNGTWGLPGGAVELGEMVESAARREAKEETDLDLGALELFGIYSGPEFFYRYPNGDEVYNVTIVYLARQWSGELHLNEEHTEYAWFGVDSIPQPLSPPIQPVIEQFCQSSLRAGIE